MFHAQVILSLVNVIKSKSIIFSRDDNSPILEYLPLEVKQKMRKKRTKKLKGAMLEDDREDDEVFIVEKLMKRRKNECLVQCAGYEPEWIDCSLVPSFLLENFHSSGQEDIPLPRVVSTSQSGGIVYKSLTWREDLSLPTLDHQTLSLFRDNKEGQIEKDTIERPLNCNTRKDKDSRFHRHTCGIFIG